LVTKLVTIVGQIGEVALLNLPDDLTRLIVFDAASHSVTTREGKRCEFKHDFVAVDFSEYTKTLGAFSNAGGGVLIFGVSDKPRKIVGVKNKIADEAQWADRLREESTPRLSLVRAFTPWVFRSSSPSEWTRLQTSR
jgi:hypothetical protein